MKLFPGLYLGSNPKKTLLPIFDDDFESNTRKIYCRRYDNCLTYAVKENWNSFICTSCKIEENITKDQWMGDLEGLAMLLQSIVGSDIHQFRRDTQE